MFDTYEFVFDGESSQSYGLYICDIAGKSQSDVSFGNKASIIEARTIGRLTPLHFGVNYHGAPLQFKLVFGRDTPVDRFEFERISLWLTGHQDYKWLQIVQPDMQHVFYKCLITELTPITVAWTPYGFEATVTCDCPYAYGREEIIMADVDGETEITVPNMGSVREPIRPLVSFLHSGDNDTLSITNETDASRKMLLEGIPTGNYTIMIDNHNGIIRGEGVTYNFYQSFNMNFLRLLQGNNNLVVCGKGMLVIKYRTLHNVSA